MATVCIILRQRRMLKTMKAPQVLMPRWPEALKLYHVKLTLGLAYSSLLALHAEEVGHDC